MVTGYCRSGKWFHGLIICRREKIGCMKTYMTTGTCSKAINYEVVDGVVTKCEFIGGCPGNTSGVAKLVVGRKVEDVITLLKGIRCRGDTSCPDQLAHALERDQGLVV